MDEFKWNAKDYRDNSSIQQEWARELIARLELKGDEKVLDIGCGDGKITAEIAGKLPYGSIVGVDNSKEMIDLANSCFQNGTHKNISFKLGDAKKLNFDDEFDIVFSNATLHWITDHTPVLEGIKKALKIHGKSLLQMGGKGNAGEIIDEFDSVRNRPEWESYFAGFEFPYGFFDPEEYKVLLDETGLKINYIKLINKDMTHNNIDGLKGWIRTTWLPYTTRVPGNLQNLFIDQIVNNYINKHPLDDNGCTHVKMVRLEVMAEKPF
jgi:trans-aconitate 2-methyltransferase